MSLRQLLCFTFWPLQTGKVCVWTTQQAIAAEAIFFHKTVPKPDTTMILPFHDMERSVPRLRGLGLIPAIVSRTGRSNSSNQTFIMSLETGPNASHPVLIATREHRSTRTIFQNRAWVIQDTTGRDLGVLSNPREGSYLLKQTRSDSEPTEVVTIHYHQYAFHRALMEGPPRQARVSVLGVADVASREAQRIGNRFSLNPHGRGRVTSIKNMQLEHKNGKLVLQFLKWGDNQFHLDYA